jgi:hypothetical protein
MLVSAPRPPFKFAGKVWSSIPQLAAAYKLPEQVVYQRLYMRWGLARAVSTPVRRRFASGPVAIGSRSFRSAAEAAAAYGVHVTRIYETLRIAETPEARDILLRRSAERRGAIDRHRQEVIDPTDGTRYQHWSEMAKAHGILPRTYRRRVEEAGWSIKEALTVPVGARIGRPAKAA